VTHTIRDVLSLDGTPTARLAPAVAAPPAYSLIVPVYNGATRLASTMAQLADLLCLPEPDRPELILVDDGSEPSATELLRGFAGRHTGAVLLRNNRNRGKGFSVRRGIRRARGRYLLFTDADLAYPLEEMQRILALLERGADVAIASRSHPDSRHLATGRDAPYAGVRRLMSRTFNGLVRATLLPGLMDTQAGLKGFSRRAADLIFGRAGIPGFAFDVELLFIARKHGLTVQEMPVCYREHEDPSSVRLSRDTFAMLRDVARVRINEWRGAYE